MKRLASVLVVLALGSVLSGCVVTLKQGSPPEPGAAVEKAKDNTGAVVCRANRMQINARYTAMISESGHGAVGVSFDSAVKEAGAKCPDGGSYSFDDSAGTTVCSVHGK